MPTIFNGTFSFDDQRSFLVQGGNPALLLLDNQPDPAGAARAHFLAEGLQQGSNMAVAGNMNFENGELVIHVTAG